MKSIKTQIIKPDWAKQQMLEVSYVNEDGETKREYLGARKCALFTLASVAIATYGETYDPTAKKADAKKKTKAPSTREPRSGECEGTRNGANKRRPTSAIGRFDPPNSGQDWQGQWQGNSRVTR